MPCYNHLEISLLDVYASFASILLNRLMAVIVGYVLIALFRLGFYADHRNILSAYLNVGKCSENLTTF